MNSCNLHEHVDYTSLCLCFLSEEVINRIIALTKEEGDAIDDKVGINGCFK